MYVSRETKGGYVISRHPPRSIAQISRKTSTSLILRKRCVVGVTRFTWNKHKSYVVQTAHTVKSTRFAWNNCKSHILWRSMRTANVTARVRAKRAGVLHSLDILVCVEYCFTWNSIFFVPMIVFLLRCASVRLRRFGSVRFTWNISFLNRYFAILRGCLFALQ